MTLTGEPTRTVFETPVPHPCDLAWSPDGSHLAIIGATEGGSDRGTGYLALVDASGETAWRWSTTNNTYEAVAWSPDGTILALAGARGDIELRSVVDASLLGRLHGHEKRILRLAWSPDGRHLASASFDGTVQVRNVRARTCERIFREHGSFVMALAWSPDGATLASGAKDPRDRRHRGGAVRTRGHHLVPGLVAGWLETGQLGQGQGRDPDLLVPRR